MQTCVVNQPYSINYQYRVKYPNIGRLTFLSKYIVGTSAENFMLLLSRLIQRSFFWNTFSGHLGNDLVYWSRLIPTFSSTISGHGLEITSLPGISLQPGWFPRLHSPEPVKLSVHFQLGAGDLSHSHTLSWGSHSCSS